MQRAFVIRPFGKKKDAAGKDIDFERVHNELIAPALNAAGQIFASRPMRVLRMAFRVA
jgi:hypothetical protein